MDKIIKDEYKKYTTMAIGFILLLLSLLYIFSTKNDNYEFTVSDISQRDEEELEDDDGEIEVIHSEPLAKIPVYICGQVNFPDVYYLDEGTIIKDAISKAGGFTDEADIEVWNLAMEIQKGEKIYIPKVGEQIDKREISYDNRVGASEPSNKNHQLININSANNQELTSLPGIGPAIAQNIIDYRESKGDFKTLQDVTNVSRIGQATLEKIKDYICFQ